MPTLLATITGILITVVTPPEAEPPAAVDEALRTELLERVERDQKVRRAGHELGPGPELQAFLQQMGDVDGENTAWIEGVIDDSGWPLASRVGADGARAAWLLVQHADRRPDFQARCLPLLRDAVERGEANPVELAYLVDRVRVKQKRPQVYATQYGPKLDEHGRMVHRADGRLVYLPPLVEDPARLDERRAAVGLPPWSTYEKSMAELQERDPFDAVRGPEPPGDPMAVARDAMERLGRRGYLAAILDLLDREAEFTSSPHATLFQDVLATRLAFVAEESEATRRGDEAYGRERAAPDDATVAARLDGFAPVPAVEAIVAAARDRRIVMVNEEHRSSIQRAFTHRLLEPLRAAGFTHVAIETLSEDPALLRERGHPVLSTGMYTRDPLFGDLVRRALALGYDVVGYEADAGAETTSTSASPSPEDTSPAEATNRRERGQAENLARLLDGNPTARVLVVAGRDHIAESSGAWTPMGGILKSMTGIDPLTVNQMTMTERSRPSFEHWAYRAADARGWLASEPVMLRNEHGTFWSIDATALDANLFHPRTRTVEGRPHWSTCAGLRHAVKLELDPATTPLLVQAVIEGEPDDTVPADQFVWWPGAQLPALMLRPGRYIVRAIDRTGRARHRTTIDVE